MAESPTNKAAKHHAKVKRHIADINVDVLSVTPGDEEAVVNSLKHDPDVEYAEPDYVGQALYVPNDQQFWRQDGLNNTGQDGGVNDADIDAPEAWDVAKGIASNGQPVKIAILDTGIWQDHPDLQGKVVANVNFVKDAPGNASANDAFGHGTAVAGIAAADTDNVNGVAGTCPNCQLMNVKVLNDNGTGNYSWWIDGIKWAADNGAKVINLSIGGTSPSQALTDAVKYARDKGAVVVAGAGNCGIDGQPTCSPSNTLYPAAIPEVISVGAVGVNPQSPIGPTANNDVLASYSNYGTWVDVVAPGNDYTTVPPHVGQNPTDEQFLYYYGTSMATPVVSGTLGLILSRNDPNVSISSVENQLFSSADKISGTGNQWMYGRINAANSVATLIPTSIPTQTPAVKKTKNRISGTVFIDINRNGKKDKKEIGYSGAVLTISNLTRTVTSDNKGKYSFPNLERTTYTVHLQLPSGYSATTPVDKSKKLTKKRPKATFNFGIAQ